MPQLNKLLLFCFVLFCFVLFCFVLFCFVLFCFVLFCFVLFCFVLFCFVLFCFVLFCFVLFCFVLFCFVFEGNSIVWAGFILAYAVYIFTSKWMAFLSFFLATLQEKVIHISYGKRYNN